MKNLNEVFCGFNKIKPFICVIILLAIFSCQKETPQSTGGEFTGPRADLWLGISVRNAVAEDFIEKARVVVFTTKGEFVSNKVYSLTSAGNIYSLKANVAEGDINLYVICNETPGMATALSAVRSVNEIESLTYSDVSTTPPLSMFAKISNLKILVDEKNNATVIVNGTTQSALNVEVTRTMAKLSMTIIKNMGKGEKFTVESLTYQVCRMPKYCNLLEDNIYPKDAGWREKVTVEGVGKLTNDGSYVKNGDDYVVPDGVDKITTPDIYIPEHLPYDKEDGDYCTYLLINTMYRLDGSSELRSASYKLNIGNRPPVDNSLNRNVHYKVYTTITSLGAMGFYAEIVPINQIDLPINWKAFEGYVIVSEKSSEYGLNKNIWNDYSEYSGILKITKNKLFDNALFRYGSVIALADKTVESDFAPATDIIWAPKVTSSPASWADVNYIASGDISEDIHTLDNIKIGKGDPCRLAGLTEDEIKSGIVDNKLWRMPTSAEMAWINTARNDTKNANGFYSFSWLLTPKTGFRAAADGHLTPASTNGYYWSSTGQKSFIFNSDDNTGAETNADPQQAYAVRCIRTTIPPSRFEPMKLIPADYLGKIVQIGSWLDGYITPYWKATVSPTDGFTFQRSSGTAAEPFLFTLDPLPNPYKSRTFTLTSTGFGLDGVVHTKVTSVNQSSLIHRVDVTLKEPTLPILNDHLRIPKAETTLKFGITITPYPFEPYLTGFESKKWNIRCAYYDNQFHYVKGTDVSYTGLSEIVIPENTWGHTRSVEFFIDTKEGEYPPYRYFGTNANIQIIFIQEK